MNHLNQCTIPGVTPNKQIELFIKCWKHLLVGHQYLACTSPPEEIIGKFDIGQ